MENCYKELPFGYEKVFEVNAKNKKTAIIFNLVSFGVMIIAVIIALLTKKSFDDELITAGDITEFAIKMLCFAVSMFAYVVLHELLHGLAYKIFTKQKLKFGVSLSCAFCGVPDVYVNKKTAIMALVTPLVVFTVVFGALAVVFWFTDPLLYVLTVILLGMHLGGCSGDIFVFCVIAFKYNDKNLLMNDDGPKQTIYFKKQITEEPCVFN